jgi:hypothetical protein
MKAIHLIYLSFLLVTAAIPASLIAQQSKNYTSENGAIVGISTGRYNNRPLYINNSNAFILTGDQPIVRFGKSQYMYGTFILALVRDGKAKWLQQCDQIRSVYTPGTMRWEVSDTGFPGGSVILEVHPMSGTTGMTLKATAQGARKGDSLIWAYGGAKWFRKQNLSWKMDVMGQPELLSWGFVPEDCRYNRVETTPEVFIVSLRDSVNQERLFTVSGGCSAGPATRPAEASFWNNPLAFIQSEAQDLPIITGTIDLVKDKEIYWAFEAFDSVIVKSPLEKGDKRGIDKPDSITESLLDPEKAYTEGKRRTDALKERLKIHTPDPYLDAIAVASAAAVDGTWYPPVFVHGAMQWNSRFPGWRTIFGGTMYGWHDRVRQEAKFYTDAQVRTSDKKEAKADPATLLTEQHPDSRFYGVGRIKQDQKFYDMQSQFFDQMVEEYRWTADPELVSFFREALELHLLWMRECFDSDGDGVYESYINTWPSDSQWYNGGGTAEETAYAYRGHLAARDMALNAGDLEAEKFHAQMLDKIKRGFFDKLWIVGKGHSGAYREQGGNERLHEDPWLYSIFLPVDAGLTSPLQSVESVYYSEWALQNDHLPGGGRQVWTSNWIPGIWSVRELWPGDNYHLALSYFLAGLPDDGYDIFRGTFLRTAFHHLSPGNFGGVQGGIDFGDCVHPFARTLVSGLFGYQPDYPNHKVVIAPKFPSGWKDASLELPDFKISFNRNGPQYNYSVRLARGADLDLRLPVQCRKIKRVMVNGNKVKWELLPGIGNTVVAIQLPQSEKAEVFIETDKVVPYHPPVFIEGNAGDVIQIAAANAQIVSFEDPQEALEDEKIRNGVITANLTPNKGFHTVMVRVIAGNSPQYRVFRIRINDPAGDAREASRFLYLVPGNASWEPVDISKLINADVTIIYQQQYLSPRPNTVSVRLGTDGYSPWTFPHWKSLPPAIRLDKAENLMHGPGRLITPQGVPFYWPSGEKNIVFTSLWDNYPVKIDFPVNKSGDAVWFLVAGSTNIMQCRIANAVIRLNYSDGSTDSLELVPPVNYWNLSTIDSHATAPGQGSRIDYTSETDRFCMPAKLPETVQLGENCRAMLLNLKMRKDVVLRSVTLETLSQEVVVGMMGISIMK